MAKENQIKLIFKDILTYIKNSNLENYSFIIEFT